MKFLAMDFGGTFVKHCIMDSEARMSDHGQLPAPLDSTEHLVEVICGLYDAYKGRLNGIALSLPGIMDTETGLARSGGAYGLTLQGQNIYDLLKPRVDVPAAIENDGKAAVLAEMWKGSLQGVKTACCCIIGSGLGGGIVMDGQLQKGEHFAAGEISGLLTEAGNYDMPGMAAFRASTSALLIGVAKAKNMDLTDFEITGFMGGTSDDGRKKYGGKDVLEWAESGDDTVIAVYNKWLDSLTAILFNLKMIIDPEKIVIGGGISRNPKFIKDLKERWALAGQSWERFAMPTAQLDVCYYTADANLVGAVYSWLNLYKR